METWMIILLVVAVLVLLWRLGILAAGIEILADIFMGSWGGDD